MSKSSSQSFEAHGNETSWLDTPESCPGASRIAGGAPRVYAQETRVHSSVPTQKGSFLECPSWKDR